MTGHNVSIKPGEPSPECQYPECYRRAQFMYTSAVTGLRVYRPWCRPHRATGQPPTQERPRKYLPSGQAWPDDVKCPHCDRAREPRGNGQRRPTCRHCRHLAVTPPPTPAPAPKPRSKPRVGMKKRRVTPPPGPVAVSFTPFVYHEGKKRHEIKVPKADRVWLRKFFEQDSSHYNASISSVLTRRYPTAMISQLWALWAKDRD